MITFPLDVMSGEELGLVEVDKLNQKSHWPLSSHVFLDRSERITNPNVLVTAEAKVHRVHSLTS